ncbi:MAG: hypothetical protein N3B12_05775 [Armatimonadetes bacterium]|nr:hypothetical protein [Armatimonadota bacterium]
MIAALVLITGVLLVLVVGAIMLAYMGLASILVSLVPLAPWLVMVGTILLILTELLLFLGGKEDRRAAWRDMKYLVPTLLVSGALWYVAQKMLW